MWRSVLLLFGLFLSTIASAQTAPVVVSCDADGMTSPEDPSAATLRPAPSVSLSIKVNFVSTYPGEASEPWTVDEQKLVCAAVHHVQLVWSSVDFQERLASIHSMILAKHFFGSDDTITGPEVYAALLKNQTLMISLAHSKDVPQCAVSLPSGTTSLQTGYLQDGTQYRCGAPLLAALTNTLAHELTHYSETLGSTDNRKNAVNNLNWVSYGIGCITENVAFTGNPCSYRAY